MAVLDQVRRRPPPELATTGLVLGGLTAFVVLVYVVVVLGGGALIGHTSSPHFGLSVLATAIVALGFDPVQTRLEAVVAQAVHGGLPTPYDVLRQFSDAVTGSYPAEELPARMARVLADGTAAASAEVWLDVDDRLVLAATWPHPADDAEAPTGPGGAGVRSLDVIHGGERLGVLAVHEREGVALTQVEERLFAGLAAQAGLVLHEARLRAELGGRLELLSARAEELDRSRARLVDLQDERRRALERDIHDGAQQHLVALAVNLRLAQALAEGSPERADALLAAQERAAQEALDTLLHLSRGIYPPLLGREGLVAAIRSAAARSPVPVEVVATDVGRYPSTVEAAAYFTCLEAIQNATKHSGATTILVRLRQQHGTLTVTVEDDGRGLDPGTTQGGIGFVNMRDRVESVGGTLSAESPPGGGARIVARLPAHPQDPAGGES
jgi:signal transduction histidine kinase